MKRIDHYVRVSRVSVSLNRWIGVRIDLLGEVFTVSLAAYLFYGQPVGAANTGVSLSLAAELCALILISVRAFNEFEVQANRYALSKGFFPHAKKFSVWNAFRVSLTSNTNLNQLKKGSHRLLGPRVAISEWSAFQLGTRRCEYSRRPVDHDGSEVVNLLDRPESPA